MKQLSFFDEIIEEKEIRNRKNFLEQLQEVNIEMRAGWPDKLGAYTKKWFNKMPDESIRTLSLFSGAGGLDIGFSEMGFEIIKSVEIEERFAASLKENSGEGKLFENSHVECIDIRDFQVEDLNNIEFIIGGPPCQSFSAAGRRAAGVSGTNDDRGMLFTEYVRILETLQPKGFLFENVAGITSSNNGEDWIEIKRAFSEAGYNITYRLLDAADYGVPQFRERIIIVGIREDLSDRKYLFPRPTHGPDSYGEIPYFSAKEAIRGCKLNEEDKEFKMDGKYGDLLKYVPPGLNYSYFTEKMGHPNPIFAWRSKFSDFLYKADPETPVRTLKAQGGKYTGPFHWNNRHFSISELKRLQTFPDAYKVVGSKNIARHQIGNSVAPQLGRMLALSIQQLIFNREIPFNLEYLTKDQELGFKKRKRQLSKTYLEKAKIAIQNLNVTTEPNKAILENKLYRADLKQNFAWQIQENGDYQTKITFNNDILEITTNLYNQPCEFEVPPFEIIIKPRNEKKTWNIGVEKVVLKGGSWEFDIFLALWKSLEYELNINNIKKDLVQLFGYYQYKSELEITLNFNKEFHDIKWNLLKKVTEGTGVGKPINKDDLSEVWCLKSAEIMSNVQFLKKLGYEVRNHNTNPQLEIDAFLIPYRFPTLTPFSVQLNKNLE